MSYLYPWNCPQCGEENSDPADVMFTQCGCCNEPVKLLFIEDDDRMEVEASGESVWSDPDWDIEFIKIRFR